MASDDAAWVGERVCDMRRGVSEVRVKLAHKSKEDIIQTNSKYLKLGNVRRPWPEGGADPRCKGVPV